MQEGGRTVLHALAAGSASGLTRRAGFSLAEQPIASWSWKVSRVIGAADNSKARSEDAPARLIFAFEGDKSKLGTIDQAALYLSAKIYGREMPYATLMYIWAAKAPVGSLIENPHTKRVQMVVASSGPGEVGQRHRPAVAAEGVQERHGLEHGRTALAVARPCRVAGRGSVRR